MNRAKHNEIIVDNFAGGGGASTGIEFATGLLVDVAINHDPDAILMHKTNHPYTRHYCENIWDADPVEVCQGRPVGLAWFSPDCKHFSKAKGSALVDRKIRGLAWVVLRWAGTVRPRVIILENVEEFTTWGPVRRGKPVKAKAGQTFRQWKKQLQDLGYQVEHRELIAADYGAPTTRKRFVLIARCDGRPIIWPNPTHSKSGKDGLKKWRAAAEIIDWSLPCYSIFASKDELREKYGVKAVRPLAPNTLRRVIRGVDKFTIRTGRPFIIPTGYGERTGQKPRLHDLDAPLSTIVGTVKQAVCRPEIAPFTFSNTGSSTGASADMPIGTVRTAGGQTLAAPSLIQYHAEQTEYVRANGPDQPMPTIDTSNRHALTSACLVEYYGAGRPLDLEEPLRTVTTVDREGVVAAHVVKFKGTNLGSPADQPIQTETAGGGTFAECRAVLHKAGAGDYGHWPKIRALLNEYRGYTMADDEILLLIIGGTAYYIADIGLRMLTPRELYDAMGFPHDYVIERDYTGKAYSRSKQVARCGNAVCPPMAEAVVRANYLAAPRRFESMAELKAAAG